MSAATQCIQHLIQYLQREILSEVEWREYSLEREGREEVCAEDSLKKLSLLSPKGRRPLGDNSGGVAYRFLRSP